MVKMTRYSPKEFIKLALMTGTTGSIFFSQTVSSVTTEVPPMTFTHMSSESVQITLPYVTSTDQPEIIHLQNDTLDNDVIEIEISREGEEGNVYLTFAVEAGEQLGWDPLFIYSQWLHETANFTSDVFIQNNNLAGLTWYPDSHYEKGTARPEGGYYINYPSPVEGYIDFIERSPRYGQVKTFATAEEQAEEIARAGWATDPHYAKKLKQLIQENRIKFGHVLAAKENN